MGAKEKQECKRPAAHPFQNTRDGEDRVCISSCQGMGGLKGGLGKQNRGRCQ